MSVDILKQSVSVPGACSMQIAMRKAEVAQRTTDVSEIGQEMFNVFVGGQIFKDFASIGLNELGKSIREKADSCNRCDGGLSQGPTDFRECPVVQAVIDAALKGDNYFTPRSQTSIM